MKLARGYISVQKDGIYYIQSESLQRFLLSEDDKTKLETIHSILSDSTKAIVPKKVWFEIESSIVIDKTYKYKEKVMYKCPSYYDNDNILQDCECGECGNLNDIHYEGKPLQRIEPILKQAQIYEEDIETNSQAIMDRIARSDKWEKKS